MNRRHFLAGAATVVAAGFPTVFAAGSPATPTPMSNAFPKLPKGIASVPITDEVELLYYRVLSNFTGPVILGELRNLTDYWVAAPNFVLNIATPDGSTAQVQPRTIRPNIAPGARGQFVDLGGFLEPAQARAVKESSPKDVTISLCDYQESNADETYARLSPTVSDEAVDLNRSRFQASVTVVNNGELPAINVNAFALFYDEQGFYCGELDSTDSQRIAAGETSVFSIEEGISMFHSVNPLDFINREPVVVYVAGYSPNVTISCLD